LRLPKFAQATLVRRIGWLVLLKWAAFPVAPAVALLGVKGFAWLAVALGCVLLRTAVSQWEQSLRRQFVREAPMPRYLGAKLRAQYPQLSQRDTELVLRGLRQFFMAHLRSKNAFVAMPSQVADAAWHEFILHTRAYEQWCKYAFGRLLHHTPAEVLGRDPKRNDGLRRSWFWACKEESINPRAPSRLPLLFALDAKFAIPGGFSYVPDCKAIDKQAGADTYCGTSFGEGGGGGCGGDGASGDGFSFGGSDSDGGSDGGGCGGGCGGGD
jgi:hypothetical protein